MITRKQANLSHDAQVAVFDPDGMEVTVRGVHPEWDSVITDDNAGHPMIYGFEELEPSPSLLALEK